MLVVVLILALIVAVAAGLIAWSRGRASVSPRVGPKRDACPDCGAAFVHGTDRACKKCGRNLDGIAPSVRPLPNVGDDTEDDPQSRTVVASSRVAQLKRPCQSCGALLEGLSVCPKCGVRQG